jgi:hypothetical protein
MNISHGCGTKDWFSWRGFDCRLEHTHDKRDSYDIPGLALSFPICYINIGGLIYLLFNITFSIPCISQHAVRDTCISLRKVGKSD